MSDGSGGAPQLDEQALERMGGVRGIVRTLVVGFEGWGIADLDDIPEEQWADARKLADMIVGELEQFGLLAASPGGGELDRDSRLSGISAAGITQIEERLDDVGVPREEYAAQAGGVAVFSFWGRINRLLNDFSKLRARLDRKDP